MGSGARGSWRWWGRVAVFVIVAAAVGWFAAPTLAGLSSTHVGTRVKAHGLTRAERRAIQIVSVLAGGDDSSGLVVTVKFKGDVQDLLGQGDLKHGLVALVLLPKAGGATPTGVVDEGGGSYRQHAVEVLKSRSPQPGTVLIRKILKLQAPERVLSNTGSHDFGASRHGNELVFFVGGISVSALRAIEVKAFATAPTGRGRRARAAADPGIPDWHEILKKKPTDLGQLGVDPSALNCDQLKALRDELSKARDELEIQLQSEENAQNEELEAYNFFNSVRGLTHDVLIRISNWVTGHITGSTAPTIPEVRAKIRAALNAIGARITQLKTDIANIDKMIDQIDELLKKCESSTTPPPPTPTRTAMGSLSNGSGSALAYSVQTNTPANAFEINLPSGINITGTSTPAGFSCKAMGNTEICTGGNVQPNTPVTGSFDHTGTIAANCGCVQVAFSQDNGMNWSPNPPATLTGPPSDSPPPQTAMGSLTNGSGSILNYSIQTNTTANGFEIILPTGLFITMSPPSGFSCNDMGNKAVCTGGNVQPNTPLTGFFDHTGTIEANCGCVQLAFTQDNGATFYPNPPATFTGPPANSP